MNQVQLLAISQTLLALAFFDHVLAPDYKMLYRKAKVIVRHYAVKFQLIHG